ncbi:MAG: GTPase HflX [Actinomycetota bacterium]|nr:GTPase HflX [Actinomycetota bacterium]
MTPSAGRQRRRLTATEVDLGVVRQRALLVGVDGESTDDAEASLDELALLTDTAGADPVERATQRRETPDPATYIGKGKAAELAELAETLDVDVVVFDVDLSPAQQRNLEKLFERDVVDREAVILDIFAQHAHSAAGMLQVELAQLRYRLPRLRGRGVQMSRQEGGIGAKRGPGETKLEVDRRRILSRIAKLERELVDVAKNRTTQRKARRRTEHPQVALVGYTNAGKSTLLNHLTGAGVLVEDRLFSTLDSTVRRLALPGGETVLVSDTVGFVRKLPHQLVESFRSTLEEVRDADLVLHVVDASVADPVRQIQAVRAVMAEIDAGDIPELMVVNKIDVADPDTVADLVEGNRAVPISAVTGEGTDKLLETLAARLRALNAVVELTVPYDRGDVVAAIHRAGEVLVEVHDESGSRIRARLPRHGLERFAEYMA